MRYMRFVPVTALLLLSLGCGRREEVRHYSAPKDPTWRMLGGIASANNATWFFKVVAPSDRLEAHKPEVVAFLRSLVLEEGKLRWTVPAGWTETKATPNRVANLEFGDRDPKLEMAISRLEADGGGLAENVNRWREQLGLARIGASDVLASLEKIPAGGMEVHLADLSGPNQPAMGGRGMAAPKPAEPAPAAKERPVSFDLPPGWSENPNPSRARMMEFLVQSDAGKATVSLTTLEGQAGGLAANIDRWRNQVGLEPLGDQAVSRSAIPMTFVGFDASLVEAIGTEKGILGVISMGADASLFLKMEGPSAVVAAQRGNFVSFAQSFRMRRRDE